MTETPLAAPDDQNPLPVSAETPETRIDHPEAGEGVTDSPSGDQAPEGGEFQSHGVSVNPVTETSEPETSCSPGSLEGEGEVFVNSSLSKDDPPSDDDDEGWGDLDFG